MSNAETIAKWESLIARLTREVIKDFGERCEDYQPLCATCHAWRSIDDLAALTETMLSE